MRYKFFMESFVDFWDNKVRMKGDLKRIIILDRLLLDNLIPEMDQLFWYNFPTTGKPSDELLKLLGEGVRK
ncbi:MAG: hypothetical protein N2746_01900 [Deltaproteobacteria bacterium]|nr:hypothetical protein [Deltaproteobacteria bacterium]